MTASQAATATGQRLSQRMSAPRISTTVVQAAQPAVQTLDRPKKKVQTLKFGHRESYGDGQRPSQAHITEIPVSSGGVAGQLSGLCAVEENLKTQGGVRASVKRCSVVSVPGQMRQEMARSSVMSTASEWWTDDTIDEEQLKAATKLANKLAARRGGPKK